MAHFAKIDELGTVLCVVVVNNTELIDSNGNESESLGIAFCVSTFGGGTWVQTSYNARIRKNLAGVGFRYDQQRDAFIPPKPYDSWQLDEETCQWKAPKPRPDGEGWFWFEPGGAWLKGY